LLAFRGALPGPGRASAQLWARRSWHNALTAAWFSERVVVSPPNRGPVCPS